MTHLLFMAITNAHALLKKIILSCCLFAMLPVASGQVMFECDNIKYGSYTPNTVTVIKNTSPYTGNITIPATVSNEGFTYTVTGIGFNVFRNCTGLTGINLPNTITDIGANAFSGCTGLTAVTLPNTLKTIGSDAFSYCSNLTSINMPPVTTIGNNAFSDCSKLTSLTLPPSVKHIGQSAFYNCTSLNVNIPDSVVSIGATAYNKTLLSSVTLPQTLTTLAVSAFDNTSWYNGQPNGMVYIGEWFYRYKGSLPSNASIEIREGTKHMAQYAFSYSLNLNSVTLPGTITEIPTAAFSNCFNLSSINMPESIKRIGDMAFSACLKLMTINLPAGVTRIGEMAFDNTGWYNSQPNGNVYIGNWYYKYKGTMPANTEIKIADGTVGIADLALFNMYNLTSVSMPATLRHIPNSSFQGCSQLSSIYAMQSEPLDLTGKSLIFYQVNKYNCKLYVPSASVNLYKSATEWKDFSNIIGITSGVNALKEGIAGAYSKGLTIYLPDTDNKHFCIYNMQGKMIYSGNNYRQVQVDAPGVYLVYTTGRLAKIMVGGI